MMLHCRAQKAIGGWLSNELKVMAAQTSSFWFQNKLNTFLCVVIMIYKICLHIYTYFSLIAIPSSFEIEISQEAYFSLLLKCRLLVNKFSADFSMFYYSIHLVFVQ